ncbi:MAG: hypothetical protein CVT67_03415 [Actinobacteria bacterium HGW-Actinobacteria-7]|nr:MAG: hypothetical protein CVT67_03415 [Actinobacteria bacterium HGW-Actinobacteria-7]
MIRSRPAKGKLDVTFPEDDPLSNSMGIEPVEQALEETESVVFEDLFDLEDIQRLQESFAKATGVASIITRLDGSPITAPSGFCRLCSEIIRGSETGLAHCYESDAALGRVNSEGPVIQTCLSGGLWDAGASITVGGKHIANWLIGQVRDETQSDEQMSKYAREIGVDEQGMLAAFREVPSMSREQFGLVADALFILASQLSTSAYQNIQQARFIAKRRQAEERLNDREQWLNESQRVASLGHYIFDIKKDYWEGSPSLYEVLGIPGGPGGDFEGWLELVHPLDREMLTRYFTDEVLGGRQSFDLEYRILRPSDDGERWVHGLGKLSYDEAGTPSSMFGIIQDITDRKVAEQELRRSEEKLNEAQHHAHIGSWTWDIKADRLEWSDEMFHLFGLEQETFNGALQDVIAESIHPDDRGKVEASNAAVINEGRPSPVEYRIVWPDSSVHTVWAAAGRLESDEQGNPTLLSGTVQDITQRKEAESEILRLNAELEDRVRERTEELTATIAELAETNSRLEEATRAKSDFLAAMSHELRTPLNSVIGFSGVLLQGLAGPLTEEQGHQVGMINNSGRHLLGLVNEVLDLAKIESAQTVATIGATDVGAIASGTLDSVRPLADEKGIEMRCSCPDGLGLVQTDGAYLEQILLNLVGNAIKFTDEGFVSVVVSRDESGVVVAVEDSGCGIEGNEIDRVFDDFYQASANTRAKAQGTGLGLAVSRRLAESIGAQIDVSSEPSRGSVFTLRLPDQR